MSRLVRKQISIPNDVIITSSGNFIDIKGKLGSISIFLGSKNFIIDDSLKIINNNIINGLNATLNILLKNGIEDITNGFSAKLKMIGVGYKAVLDGRFLRFMIGFSHDVVLMIPKDLKIVVEKDVEISVSGNDRNLVMPFAKMIRDLKKPEPYKGKGIFLNDEQVVRKEGKRK